MGHSRGSSLSSPPRFQRGGEDIRKEGGGRARSEPGLEAPVYTRLRPRLRRAKAAEAASEQHIAGAVRLATSMVIWVSSFEFAVSPPCVLAGGFRHSSLRPPGSMVAQRRVTMPPDGGGRGTCGGNASLPGHLGWSIIGVGDCFRTASYTACKQAVAREQHEGRASETVSKRSMAAGQHGGAGLLRGVGRKARGERG
jgi:hypothetical protein